MNEHLLAAANATPANLNNLDALSTQVVEYKRLEKAYKDLENEAKEAKKAFNKVSQEVIPELMLQNGISKIETADGQKVAVKDELSASVTDMLAFSAFLEKRGDSDILKTTLEMGKVPNKILQQVVEFCRDHFDIIPDVGQKVHHATLAKYVKELCGVGGDSEAEFTASELDMLSIFQYHKTTVK